MAEKDRTRTAAAGEGRFLAEMGGGKCYLGGGSAATEAFLAVMPSDPAMAGAEPALTSELVSEAGPVGDLCSGQEW